MNGNQNGSGNLLDTTDCLEAVGIFKGWKNFFFIILILCILVLQTCFWLVDLGMIPIPQNMPEAQQIANISVAITEPNLSSSSIPGEKENIKTVPEPAKAEAPPIQPPKTNEIPAPAVTIEPNKPTEPNQPAEPNQAEGTVQGFNTSGGPVILAAQTEVPSTDKPSDSTNAEKSYLFGINFGHIVWIIHFVNALFILTAVLYCLTMLFSLKVSMLGRLGGINHITRAFFLSLIMLILVLPWQIVFDNTVIGAIFTSSEIVKWQAEKTGDMIYMILYYMRFCGYMVLTFLLLILAQIRSGRWAKAILRRLEII